VTAVLQPAEMMMRSFAVSILLATLLAEIEQCGAFSMPVRNTMSTNSALTRFHRTPPSSVASLSLLTSDGDSLDTRTEPPRFAYLGLWAGLLAYVYALAPGSSLEATNIDTEIILKMVTTPFDGTTNPLFVLIFNSLGVIPAVYASLLLPGAKDQKFPALPFVGSAFALGFFGVGPYLGLREVNTEVTQEDVQEGGRGVFESKFPAAGMLAFFAYLVYFCLSSGDLGQQATDFTVLFSTQKLVHVSTIDAVILTLAMWDPLSEDLGRRVKNSDSNPMLPAWMYCVVPVLGPVVYLLTRPKLPSSSSSSG
jgi:cadmium resistance protein CadD (predicted permease)